MAICPLRIRGICSVAAICMLQKQKSELFCNFFAIRDCHGAPRRGFRTKKRSKSAAKRLISALRRRKGVPNRKKVASWSAFLFLRSQNDSVGQIAPRHICLHSEDGYGWGRLERGKQKRLAKSKPLPYEVVPEAGFEPARLSTTVFETAASAVPPLGRRTALYLKPENSSSETNYS